MNPIILASDRLRQAGRRGPPHDLGGLSIIASDSQAMGHVGAVVTWTWQTAYKMKLQRLIPSKKTYCSIKLSGLRHATYPLDQPASWSSVRCALAGDALASNQWWTLGDHQLDIAGRRLDGPPPFFLCAQAPYTLQQRILGGGKAIATGMRICTLGRAT